MTIEIDGYGHSLPLTCYFTFENKARALFEFLLKVLSKHCQMCTNNCRPLHKVMVGFGHSSGSVSSIGQIQQGDSAENSFLPFTYTQFMGIEQFVANLRKMFPTTMDRKNQAALQKEPAKYTSHMAHSTSEVPHTYPVIPNTSIRTVYKSLPCSQT